MHFFAMDLGGTTVKYALVDSAGCISHEGNFPTASRDAEQLFEKIIKIAQEYKSQYQIKGIGCSCAGVVEPYTGEMLGASFNMPKGWCNAQVKKVLEQALSLPVIVENDVNSAALGEKWLGAGRDYHTFICIAMGTGIGSGIIINNHLYYGSSFTAGEIAFIRANKGNTSFWESEASTLALVRRVQTYLTRNNIDESEVEAVDGRWIFEHAETDSNIKMILEDWADQLAGGIADVVCVLNPQAVILGGGVSAQKDVLIELLMPRLKAYLPIGFKTELKIAAAGNNAGKLGVVKRLIDEYSL